MKSGDTIHIYIHWDGNILALTSGYGEYGGTLAGGTYGKGRLTATLTRFYNADIFSATVYSYDGEGRVAGKHYQAFAREEEEVWYLERGYWPFSYWYNGDGSCSAPPIFRHFRPLIFRVLGEPPSRFYSRGPGGAARGRVVNPGKY